ncbi:hypothetical protein NP233_g9606 [Leucocoprinus birnbaumii]|uniref:Large ribosomal subunit protein eL14 domain-containing protein n=1 Tax=Leucocoprinus birnbaumii TaxID=56174 RepID=A0AAD5VMF0_9AGAR|nr:hypothetical protein NP233_g9606 [Leucocoprinus birnbaumii]
MVGGVAATVDGPSFDAANSSVRQLPFQAKPNKDRLAQCVYARRHQDQPAPLKTPRWHQKSAKSSQNSVGWETQALDDALMMLAGIRAALSMQSGWTQISNVLLRLAEVRSAGLEIILVLTIGVVILIRDGPLSGKIAVIAEIIDHNRAIIDGPSTGVPRQSFPYKHLLLTPFKLTKLPRGAGSGVIQKLVEREGIVEKWDKSAWAQKRATKEKRQSLGDFDRFKVMLAKKQRRDVVRKALKKASA